MKFSKSSSYVHVTGHKYLKFSQSSNYTRAECILDNLERYISASVVVQSSSSRLFQPSSFDLYLFFKDLHS